MNIVKFKDIVLTPALMQEMGLVDENYQWVPGCEFVGCGKEPQEVCDFFNGTYRNRYTLVVNCQWIMPMDQPITRYIELSKNPSELPHIDPNADMEEWVLSLSNFNTLLDLHATKKYGDKSVEECLYINNFAPDGDVTLDELKVFMTWLATILLQNTSYIEDRPDKDTLVHMLEYYSQVKYDDTVKWLNKFSTYMNEQPLVMGQTLPVGIVQTSGCACNGGAPALQYTGNTIQCDPIQMYRNAIYNYMVDVFSDYQYWTAQVLICVEMKKYIDGILKANLPLHSQVVDIWADCTCSAAESAEERRYRIMLENLSRALQLIIDDQVSGNINFISKSFTDWATYLYENMYWK